MNSALPIRPAQGLSIVELLVGITVGLFVLAGATLVATNQISDNRRLLLETQIQQDMRTAMDIIVRDVRRSGYGFKADQLPAIGASAPTNGYSPAGSLSSTNALLYTYSSIASDLDNNAADAEDFKGFKREGDVIKVQLGKDNWQPLTDADVVKITEFTAMAVASPRYLPTTCAAPPCPGTGTCGSPRVESRIIRLTMTGQARHDSRVERKLESTVRVRNDEVCL